MKLKWKALILNLLIPLSIGFLSGFLNRSGMEQFNTIIKPAITPPAYIFPIVWTVLYVLMGISAYLITASSATKEEKAEAYKIYALQLGMNFLWSFIFFNMGAYLFAFIWLVLLWFMILIMIFVFYQISKPAALLQIPYLIWVTFAGWLNWMIYNLNK